MLLMISPTRTFAPEPPRWRLRAGLPYVSRLSGADILSPFRHINTWPPMIPIHGSRNMRDRAGCLEQRQHALQQIQRHLRHRSGRSLFADRSADVASDGRMNISRCC
jgi:hypothetical protein